MKSVASRPSAMNRQDLAAGLFFLLLGGGALVYAVASYRLGSPSRMGPGFFPALVGAVTGLIGAAILVRARLTASAASDGAPDLRREVATLASILLAVVAFGLMLKPFGLVVSLVVMTVLARLTRLGTWLELATLAAVLVAIAYVIFVLGLRMPIPLGIR